MPRFVYEIPAGWSDLTRAYPEFLAGGARVKFSILQGSAGGVGPNVNRWRGQVGLPTLGSDEAEALAKPFDFLGEKGLFVEATGKEFSTLVVFKIRREQSCFLKMMGPVGEVVRHRAAFEHLAGTLKMGDTP